MFTTTSDYFARGLHAYQSDSETLYPWIYGPRALLLCSCGNVEECEPDTAAGRVWPCSNECHLPRCPKCRQHVHDCEAEPRVMLRVEPFRTDRLLPRSDDSSFEHSPPHPSVGVNVLTKLDGFTITRPYHAHTQVTADPGDFRTGSGPEELGRVFER